MSSIPRHIGIIMDGNGRWARKRFLPRIEGHRSGAKSVRMAVEECRKLGVKYLTLYAFSTENWSRPEEEISGLMKLFIEYLRGEVGNLIKNKVRLRSIGQKDRLAPEIRSLLEDSEAMTHQDAELDLVLALSYGGRQELVDAVKSISTKIQNGEMQPGDISAETIAGALYAPDIPDPDLIIRTSDEHRLSNFLLWQSAYAEFVFSTTLWPDFDKKEFHRCIEEFSKRERRFGLSEPQPTAVER